MTDQVVDVFDEDGDAYTATVAVTGSARSESLRTIRQNKLDAAFKGRKFDIEREVHLPEGQAFRTLLGNTGRHGWVIRDRDSGQQWVVTSYLLRTIFERYQGIEQMPDARPRLIG